VNKQRKIKERLREYKRREKALKRGKPKCRKGNSE
jgi:hypothetical protein